MLVFRAASTAVLELPERQSSPKSRSAHVGAVEDEFSRRVEVVAAQVGVPALVVGRQPVGVTLGALRDQGDALAFTRVSLSGRVAQETWPCKSNSVRLGSSLTRRSTLGAFGLSAAILAAGPVQPEDTAEPRRAR
jgi:hypothetical protein